MRNTAEYRFSSVLLTVSYSLWLSASPVAGKGAGRAFPIASENLAIDSFQTINPDLEWDPSNFLIDLSGHYANCKALSGPLGVIPVNRATKDGRSIVGIVDVIRNAPDSDVTSVNSYIEGAIKRWITGRRFDAELKRASHVGCSIRPGCEGNAVVACLFASGQQHQQPDTPEPLKETTTTRRPTQPTVRPATTTTPRPTTTTTARRTTTTEEPELPLTGIQRALAFTPQQYKIAEGFLGKAWDQSHYLENLSGFETNCTMIGTSHWSFDYIDKFNRKYGLDIKGQYGYEQNRGSTPEALDKILAKFSLEKNVKDMGCSLIPDCIQPGTRQMYVVVSCLTESGAKR